MPSMAAHFGSFEIGPETGSGRVRLNHVNVLKDGIAIASLQHLVDVLHRYLFNNIFLFTIANKAD